MANFEFPSRVNHFRKQLALLYRGEKENLLSNILQEAPANIQEEVDYDNWNGGQYGHAITFYVDDVSFSKIANFENRKKLCEKIKKDLNEAIGSIQNEFISDVYIELYDEEDEKCKNAVQPSGLPVANPVSSHLWKPKSLRLFISHKSKYKKEVNELAKTLEPFGVSSFVAHEVIKPTKKWQREIKLALASMDAFLIYLTNDFSKSEWTDQETGFAIARNVPIIPLKMGETDPYGFFGDIQALSGNPDDSVLTSKKVFKTLTDYFDGSGKIRAATISAFIFSKSFIDTIAAFERLKELEDFTTNEIGELVSGFNKNNQLFACGAINRKNQFLKFINANSVNSFEMENGKIEYKDNEEIPF